MEELKDLIEALSQYNKKLSHKYSCKLQSVNLDIDVIKKEIIKDIKKHRWTISKGKKEDEEYAKYIDKYLEERNDWN